jgi:hypothetical protein
MRELDPLSKVTAVQLGQSSRGSRGAQAAAKCKKFAGPGGDGQVRLLAVSSENARRCHLAPFGRHGECRPP